MVELDLDLMKSIAEKLYIPMVNQECGPEGEAILKDILAALKYIYQYIPPEKYSGPIVIFKTLNDDDCPLSMSDAVEFIDASILHLEVGQSFTVQVLDNRRFLLWKDLIPDVRLLAQVAVVYQYKNRTEMFYAKGGTGKVINPSPLYASCFAIPTFDDLRSALHEYRTKWARHCSCDILSHAWYDPHRIFLKNAKEETMRRSLTQFLKTVLRGSVEVRPEQIVDESHPVDIKVTWELSNRRAIIEIKWLGVSRHENGKKAVSYTASRARDGAKQLAEYLDANKKQSPYQYTLGYLVVFDGRRGRLTKMPSTISCSDGMKYKDEEIEFSPKYHESRDDFEQPIRLFVEPICT